MDILKGVAAKGTVVVIPVALVTAFSDHRELSLGILAGAVFGILNLRGLIRSVEGFVGSGRLTGRVVFMSMIRLSLLFSGIFLLVWLKVASIFGILFGLTVIFTLIVLEGIRLARRG